VFEQPVYDGPYAKAAALVHTLGRCRWLERSNLAVTAATGVMYLEATGIPVKPAREDAIALRDLLQDAPHLGGHAGDEVGPHRRPTTRTTRTGAS
jgi:hypothetical protein